MIEWLVIRDNLYKKIIGVIKEKKRLIEKSCNAINKKKIIDMLKMWLLNREN